jgi:hypothetical protein
MMLSFKPAGADEATRQQWRAALRREQTENLLLVRVSLRVTGLAAAVFIAASAWVWMNAPQPAAIPPAPAPWEQTALLADEGEIEVAGANGESSEIELAQWIVSDLSNAGSQQ